MSMEDAKKFYDLVASDKSVRDELMKHWDQVTSVAKKHGCHFTHAEYYDFLHAHTGMTNVPKAEDSDGTDTCICVLPSEPPRF